jgi:putative transposase
MPGEYKIGENIFPFYTKIEVCKYIDAFVHISLKETVLDGIVHLQDKHKVLIHGWIVLPGSVKLIFSCDKEGLMMEDVVEKFMNYTDRKLVENVNNFRNETKKRWMVQMFAANRSHNTPTFWHPKYYLAPLETQDHFSTCLSDMHESPVRSAVVWDAQHYMYSSAIDYAEAEPGLLPVVKLESSEDYFL